VHSEKWSKVTVVLFDRQVARVDALKRQLDPQAKQITRAALLRAIIDAGLDCFPRRLAVDSEAELRAALTQHFCRR
jgi:hypothetical protein